MSFSKISLEGRLTVIAGPQPPSADGFCSEPSKKIRWAARCRFCDNDGRTRPVEAWGGSGAETEQRLRDELTSRKRASSDTITADTRLEVLVDYWLRTKMLEQARGEQLAVVPVHNGAVRHSRRRRTEAARMDGVRLEAWVAGEVAKHPANARVSLTCLKGMLDVAVREDVLAANPAKSVTPVPATVSDDESPDGRGGGQAARRSGGGRRGDGAEPNRSSRRHARDGVPYW